MQVWQAVKFTPTFQVNWANQDPLKAPLQAYLYASGLVVIEGAIAKPTAIGTNLTIAILPLELRPSKISSTGLFDITMVGATPNGRYQMYPDGSLRIVVADTTRVVTQAHVQLSYNLNNA